MKNSKKPLSFGDKALAMLAGMSKEEFLAAVEERCPSLIHGRGPQPADAMVPGSLIETGPSDDELQAEVRAELARLRAEKAKAHAPKKRAAAVAASPRKQHTRVERVARSKD